MTSSPSSRISVLALVAVLIAALATPVAAVELASEDVPDANAAGDEVTASYEITNLYQNPAFESWNLTGSTELEQVTWTVSFINPSGETVAKENYDGQSFETRAVSSNSDIDGDGQPETVTDLRVTVSGIVPEPTNFTYPEEEEYLVAELVQARGESGSTNTIGTWNSHHYTTGEEDAPGSQQARTEIAQADAAIANASAAGGDVADAETNLQNAQDAYRSGQFNLAVNLANQAENKAVEAKEAAESSQQMNQLLMFGGIGLVVVLLVVGGIWYWRNQGDDYDKLG